MKKMNPHGRRVLASVAVGLVAALSIAALLIAQVARIESSRGRVEERFGADIVEVLVASKAIPVGEPLSSSNTRVVTWLSTLLPVGAVRAADAGALFGTRVAERICQGEPVVTSRIGAPDQSALRVAAGLTAVSIACDPITALGGEIRPGMMVDVMGSMGSDAVDLLVDDAQVLSASNTDRPGEEREGVVGGFSSPEREVSWVTLAVPDGVVKQLIAVATAGRVHLVLPGSKGGRSDV